MDLKIWAYFRDGVFTGDAVHSSTAPGAREGLELREVEVLPPPPRPADTPDCSWDWSEAECKWLRIPTVASLARAVRAERDARMAAADWVTLRAVRTGQPVPPDWAAYLQALADVPAQPGFPATVVWPEPPAAP
jgi:hypothetical protein